MDALAYNKELIRFESTSPLSNVEVSNYCEDKLKALGFDIERIEYDDANGVRKANVIAKKGNGTGGVAYFCHTDVVPADTWRIKEHGPFEPAVEGDKLYGRGSCDMKGSLSCALAAAERFSADELKQPFYITCTADEEVGYIGAKQVAQKSKLYREMVEGDARGIIGEPTMLEVVYAHKGTTGFSAVSQGRAAHSSTDKGLNANLAMIPFLAEMKAIHDETLQDPAWRDERFNPPTISWNIGINDHTTAINITPPQSVCTVYFRVMPNMDAQILVDRARKVAEKCGLEFQAHGNGAPLYVDPHSDFVNEFLDITGKTEAQTVTYGTDGAMFSDLKRKVVYGPGDIAQAHTDDEWITLEQLEQGTEMFEKLIRRWCT
ncbi:Acetylornithine deacetylase [Symmachiella macrocystis]|uniref:Acetylornithine deacetylase n=1 Tax=Symmachiella macrocystis TaxID=2527985 RepID=A0A5C6BAK9_9PLAN|nr:M20 family metallopeptidase [Symmachiella macrocystis]TWU09030.1 Acetylornithine deacetylase [Symmachiella macrocystis]